ncbi:porin family protein [Mucilaginibacter sp. McL0603]|uniref:porin family protein n=1 Tax=Mucilaginibacter sp. McL0603 TaxID=3415670 RepID=UPI003CF54626
MKKIPLTLCLFLATITICFAQSLNFGIKAGLNLSTQSINPSGTADTKNLTGFHAGIIVDIGLKNFSIQPGLFFTTKGEVTPQNLLLLTGVDHGTYNAKEVLNYIEVPVNFLYNIKDAPKVKIYFGGGPYLAYGISGHGTTWGSMPTYTVHFDTYGYKNPDYGVNFVAGIELSKKILIDANYGLGLGNLSREEGLTIRNRVIGISVGYLF